jgi:hypothetical protein
MEMKKSASSEERFTDGSGIRGSTLVDNDTVRTIESQGPESVLEGICD